MVICLLYITTDYHMHIAKEDGRKIDWNLLSGIKSGILFLFVECDIFVFTLHIQKK